MTSSEVRKLATGDSARKKRILSSTKKLRECLASIFYAIAAGQVPPTGKLRTLSVLAREERKTEHLEWRDSRLTWRSSRDRTNRSGHAVPKTGLGCSGPADLRGNRQAERLFKPGMSLVISGRKQEQRATVVRHEALWQPNQGKTLPRQAACQGCTLSEGEWAGTVPALLG